MRHPGVPLAGFVLTGFAVVLLPGCFRGADVSKIVCNATKYCPAGYACVIPPGQDRGGCERVSDGGAQEGPAVADVPSVLDGPLPADVAVLDMARDMSIGGFDQALPGSLDASAEDVRIGGDAAEADFLPDRSVDVATSVDAGSGDAPLKGIGASCQLGGECSSAICADGVCCDGPCTGQCQACAEPGSLGTCVTVAGAPRGARSPCAAAQPVCAGQCGGLPDRCTYPGSDLVCSAAVCASDSELKPASVCDGAGACSVAMVAPCGAGKYCAAGACVSQLSNGGACQTPGQCVSGNCSNGLCCASGLVACGASCVSLSSSSANCGSCGRSCATGSRCSGGACYLNDGQACVSGNQCLSGVCSTFYPDGDGDGHGAGTGVSQCGTTAPAGYANKAGDCCDSDGNAHPGQAAYFTTANLCGSFDYDCDEQATAKSNGPPLSSCEGFECEPVGDVCNGSCIAYSTAACGVNYVYRAVVCGWQTGGGGSVCDASVTGNQVGPQACN